MLYLFNEANSFRRDKIAAVLVGIHTGVFLCLVVGATVVDQTNQSIDGTWLVLAIFSEVAMRITMEFFQVATIRDWIIEVPVEFQIFLSFFCCVTNQKL